MLTFGFLIALLIFWNVVATGFGLDESTSLSEEMQTEDLEDDLNDVLASTAGSSDLSLSQLRLLLSRVSIAKDPSSHYKIGKKLGAGLYGGVYQCLELKTSQMVRLQHVFWSCILSQD